MFLFGKEAEPIRRSEEEIERAYEIVGNWRSAHNYPLNAIQQDLRKRADNIGSTSFVAQRIKRISSIESKIVRLPRILLSEMQDIGGCRAVMNNVQQVQELVKSRKESRIKHELAGEKDYIAEPKPSGYRGVHLIYRFVSSTKKSKAYTGLKVEVQIRTPLQHAWATAVRLNIRHGYPLW